MTTENPTITIERVDDIPLLVAQANKMGLPALLDEQYWPHGNWQGTSFGWTVTIWLTHILSQGDHRLSQVQSWVNERQETLSRCRGEAIRELEWSDDRLAIVLVELSDTQRWQKLEQDLTRQTIRVYRLTPQRVHVDSTTSYSHWSVSEEGLFQYGHSKDHRPDLPQLKVMMAVLDGLGMPVVTQVVAGNRADDPLYLPTIAQVQQTLAEPGLLYVGDSKMGAVLTRASLQSQGDYYLCPLSEKQLPAAELAHYLQPIWDEEIKVVPLYREDELGQNQWIAEGYERVVEITQEVAGQPVTWEERRLVVRSLAQARASTQALDTRLDKAQAELAHLLTAKRGKKRLNTGEAIQLAAAAIVKQHRVADLLTLTIDEQSQERQVRPYRSRSARTEIVKRLTLTVSVDEAAVNEAKRWFGWRVYATNQPSHTLSLSQAVLAYREEYLVERNFGRLKGKSLSLQPMYLQSENRAVGLIRLLSLALRLLTVVEFQVRRQLVEKKEGLAGLYAGNPKRTTTRPTTEAILKAFKGINLLVVRLDNQVHRHVTPLSGLQEKLLALLELPPDIYTRLVTVSTNST